MREENREIEAILSCRDDATFTNSVEALELSGSRLRTVSGVMYNLLSLESSDALEELAEELAPLLSEHTSSIWQNPRLYQRMQQVASTWRKNEATEEERTLLEETLCGFERAGAGLREEDSECLRQTESRIAELTLRFSENLRRATADYTLHVADEERLAGLPQSIVQAAAERASERGEAGWTFTLQAPCYVPFMEYADDRELRRELYTAYHSRCSGERGKHSNLEIVHQLSALRSTKAGLLGFGSYADFVITRRMAGATKRVEELLSELQAHYLPAARSEVELVTHYAHSKGLRSELQPWDFAYYAEALARGHYDFDLEQLRPYLPLDQCLAGIFSLCGRLWGIRFCQRADIPTWHPDVLTYSVEEDDGTLLSLLYLDLHPREAKRSGAWMSTLREATEGERPHVVVACNITRPRAPEPALLSHSELTTLLHEMGHALHAAFARGRYASLSGTNVKWDFVEFPSQLMESYASEPAFLSTFARHYQTGEPLPEVLTEGLRRRRTWLAGYSCIRQVSYGLLDLAWYAARDAKNATAAGSSLKERVATFEADTLQDVKLLPQAAGCLQSTQFSHIFSGGYAAGYYSYKWAEMLSAEAFEVFRREGIFNRDTARRLRSAVLEKGATEPPMRLYTDFTGSEPTIDALLCRDGLPLTERGKLRSLDRRYLRMASIWAENSYCRRRQVGALIVKDKMIISDGFNGTPSGFENVCEDENGLTRPYVLHAEANAITKIARSGNNADGATLYVTDSPCIECAKLIIQSGIRRVVYARQYRLTDGLELLRQAGIEVCLIKA